MTSGMIILNINLRVKCSLRSLVLRSTLCVTLYSWYRTRQSTKQKHPESLKINVCQNTFLPGQAGHSMTRIMKAHTNYGVVKSKDNYETFIFIFTSVTQFLNVFPSLDSRPWKTIFMILREREKKVGLDGSCVLYLLRGREQETVM